MQTIPNWRDNPEPVYISIEILEKDEVSGQILASFRVGGEKFAVTVDETLIDPVTKQMMVLIIADVGANKYLVDLPGESPSAGSRILVGTADIKTPKGK